MPRYEELVGFGADGWVIAWGLINAMRIYIFYMMRCIVILRWIALIYDRIL